MIVIGKKANKLKRKPSAPSSQGGRTSTKPGIKAKRRRIFGNNGSYELSELQRAYSGNFGVENVDLRSEKTYFWKNL
jgi:hypothetical protein